MGKDTDNSLVSMFGYIDSDNEKNHKMVKDVLSPVVGRPVDETRSIHLFRKDHTLV